MLEEAELRKGTEGIESLVLTMYHSFATTHYQVLFEDEVLSGNYKHELVEGIDKHGAFASVSTNGSLDLEKTPMRKEHDV